MLVQYDMLEQSRVTPFVNAFTGGACMIMLPSGALVLRGTSVTSIGMAWELVRNNESDVHFKISR